MEEEIKAANSDKAEIYAEAKGTGFDPAIIKIVIKRRRQDRESIDYTESMVETYERAIAGGRLDQTEDADLRQHRARNHGRADAKAANNEHEHLYADGAPGAAAYALGRQDIEMPEVDAAKIIDQGLDDAAQRVAEKHGIRRPRSRTRAGRAAAAASA